MKNFTVTVTNKTRKVRIIQHSETIQTVPEIVVAQNVEKSVAFELGFYLAEKLGTMERIFHISDLDLMRFCNKTLEDFLNKACNVEIYLDNEFRKR